MTCRIAALCCIALIGCGGDAAFSGASVNLTASGFSPNAVTIPSAGQIRFTNQDTADHQVSSTDCAEASSAVLHHSDTFTATFGAGAKTCTLKDALNTSAAIATISVLGPGSGGGGGGGPGY